MATTCPARVAQWLAAHGRDMEGLFCFVLGIGLAVNEFILSPEPQPAAVYLISVLLGLPFATWKGTGSGH